MGRVKKQKNAGEVTRAALYCRVSSGRQASRETPIEGQVEKGRKFINERGWVCLSEHTFIDEGQSGRTDDRPAFQQMIALSKQTPKPFDVIVVWKFNRLARNQEDSRMYKALLRKKLGIDVVSINEPVDDSPMGVVMEKFIEIIDELFSVNLANDCKRGMEVTARQGFFNGGNVPIGYQRIKVPYGTTEKTVLAPDKVYAPLVQRVFDLYLGGLGAKDIAKLLNSEGSQTPRGKVWTAQAILYMLKNRSYLGESLWNRTTHDEDGKVVENDPEDIIRGERSYSALVTREKFDRVQTRLHIVDTKEGDAIPPAAAGSDYLLSGLLKCGGCKTASMTGAMAKSGRYRYYTCIKQMKSGECAAKSMPVDLLDDCVLDRLRSHLLTEEHLTELLKALAAKQADAQVGVHDRLRIVKEELAQARNKLDNLYDAIERGQLTGEDLAPRLRERKGQVAALEATKQGLEYQLAHPLPAIVDTKRVREQVGRLQAVLASKDVKTQKELLRLFIQKISVFWDGTAWNVSLKYTFPAPNLLSAGNRVPELDKNGRAYGTRTRDLRLERPTS